MNIQTKLLGEVEVRDEDIINFNGGILGFENSNKFILLNMPGNETFKILQDTENVYVAFMVVNPWIFKDDYVLDIPDKDLEDVKVGGENNVVVLAIVTLSDEFEKSTMNMLAPVVINSKERIGKQYVLNQSKYSVKQGLFEVLEGKSVNS